LTADSFIHIRHRIRDGRRFRIITLWSTIVLTNDIRQANPRIVPPAMARSVHRHVPAGHALTVLGERVLQAVSRISMLLLLTGSCAFGYGGNGFASSAKMERSSA
jgi:hypothetical protein